MARIPDETIQAIRDRVDLVELVGRYVALRSAGRNHKGLCPFHEEKTASFNVNAERQIFHCFGCGAGGNAFTFLMRQENLTFPEAARELAREAGIEIQEEDRAAAGLAERLRAANDFAQGFYREQLASPEGAAARRYLAGRGLDGEIADRFGIGFAPDRWDGLTSQLRSERIPADLGAKAGLLAERARGGHYDRLRGRVTFPIQDARGRILGFGGRALGADQEPKYLNGPESPIYRKREIFFGFPGALEPMRRSGRAVVVEGYFDVVALHRAGVAEAVATCGTALTEDHARDLRRRTSEVVLCFDGDDAGQRAMRGALEVLLPSGLRVRAAVLPPGDDPDTYLEREGADALRALIDEAPPALDVAIRAACGGGLATPWERSDAVHAVAPLVGRVLDPVERGEFIRLLAMRTGVREEDVDAVVIGSRPGRDPREEPAPEPRRRGPEDRWIENLVFALLDQPQLAGRIPGVEIEAMFPRSSTGALLSELLGAIARSADLESSLEGESHRIYTELATRERDPFDEDAAIRAVDETLESMRRRSHKSTRAATTREHARQGDLGDEALLERKTREIERRRELQGVPPGAVRH